jgi:ATP-binding cassette subfamily F protein 3
VLLDALVDYGGTLIFVSHDRYFVERLATKIIEVGNATALVYPGTYKEFLWHKAHPDGQEGRDRQEGQDVLARRSASRESGKTTPARTRPAAPKLAEPSGERRREEKKRADSHARKRAREVDARRQRIEQLEARIAECEGAIRDIEQQMSAPGFYEDRTAAQPVIDEHQALMWKVGDLMHQWEMLQAADDLAQKH